MCYNVEDMVSALKDRKVDGLVVDTYVAGAKKELFSECFRIRKVFDHKSAYGVVLAGDAMKLRTCFAKFIKENRAMVFEELRKVVKAIEVVYNPYVAYLRGKALKTEYHLDMPLKNALLFMAWGKGGGRGTQREKC